MHRLLLAYVVLAAAGCTDDACTNGVCPDPGYRTAQPGPCESGYEGFGVVQRCNYTYDGERLAQVECTWRETASDGENGTDLSTWQYDASGQLTSIVDVHDDITDRIGSHTQGWQFGPDTIARNGSPGGATFDRSTFAFLPLLGSDVIWPQADIAVVTETGVTYTVTQDGSTFTRTPSTGEPISYDVDAAGHITRRSVGSVTSTWTYDGDRIAARSSNEGGDGSTYSWRYTYDAGGNVTGWSQAGGIQESYSYSCW